MITLIFGLSLVGVGFVLGVTGIIRGCVIWRKMRSLNTKGTADVDIALSNLWILIAACLFMVGGLTVILIGP